MPETIEVRDPESFILFAAMCKGNEYVEPIDHVQFEDGKMLVTRSHAINKTLHDIKEEAVPGGIDPFLARCRQLAYYDMKKAFRHCTHAILGDEFNLRDILYSEPYTFFLSHQVKLRLARTPEEITNIKEINLAKIRKVVGHLEDWDRRVTVTIDGKNPDDLPRNFYTPPLPAVSASTEADLIPAMTTMYHAPDICVPVIRVHPYYSAVVRNRIGCLPLNLGLDPQNGKTFMQVFNTLARGMKNITTFTGDNVYWFDGHLVVEFNQFDKEGKRLGVLATTAKGLAGLKEETKRPFLAIAEQLRAHSYSSNELLSNTQ